MYWSLGPGLHRYLQFPLLDPDLSDPTLGQKLHELTYILEGQCPLPGLRRSLTTIIRLHALLGHRLGLYTYKSRSRHPLGYLSEVPFSDCGKSRLSV